MYDLKEIKNNEEPELEIQDENKNRVYDRSYYKNHLTDSVLSTKTSYIPTDSLF